MRRNAEEELRAYLARIPKMNSELNFLDDVGINDKDEKIKNIRKIRYQLFYIELKKIIKEFNSRKIAFIVMKGIVFAQKLYDKPWIRNFEDMDILIDPDRLSDAVKVLQAMGYVTERETEENNFKEYLNEINREHHWTPFMKRNSASFPFIIELHVDIVPLWMFQIERHLTGKILSRRETAQEIPQMEKYDELIFQMLHLVKHYVFEMTMGFMSGDIRAALKLRDLHEIALLLEKWEGEFNIRKFTERVREYTVENEVLLVARWLQEIYPITSRKLASINLEKREKGCFVNRFCSLKISHNIQNILFQNPQTIASEVIDEMQKGALTVQCPKSDGTERWPEKKVEWVQVDSDCLVRDNHFGSYLVSGKYREGIAYHTRICALWDENYLYFYIIIDDSKASFYHHMDETEVYEINGYDYIRLHFDTGKRGKGEPFVRAFNLKPYYDQKGKMSVFIEEEFHCMGGGIRTLEKDVCKISAEKRKDQYYLAVGLPWEILHYQPKLALGINFDIWLRTDDFTMEWQSAYHAWYDIAEYARLELS